MWARAVWAVSIASIALWGIYEGGNGMHARAACEPANVGYFLTSQMVEVRNLSRQIQGLCACLDGSNCIGRGTSEIYIADDDTLAGGHEHLAFTPELFGKIGEGMGPWMRQHGQSQVGLISIGWSTPEIGNLDDNRDRIVIVERLKVNVAWPDISPQLPFGAFISTSYEANRSKPQHPSYNSDEPFAGPNSENRSLWSVIATMLVLLAASRIYLRGWPMIGGILAAYGIFGLLLRIDLWSLAIRII
jgi:hypothetical protein